MCNRYTPEVTHVACDHDVVPASLCHYLGINSLSDLPREIPILAWDWFHKCSTVSGGIPLEREAQGLIFWPSSASYLDEPVTSNRNVSPTVPERTDIRLSAPLLHLQYGCRQTQSRIRYLECNDSQQTIEVRLRNRILCCLADAGTAATRKYAPTDSDTSQSQRNGRYIDTQAYATSPEPMAVDDDGSFQTLRKRTREGALGDNEHGSDDDEEPTRAAGPVSSAKVERWRPPTSGEAVDPLDEMISGMVKGTLVQTEQELAEEARLLDESTVDGFAKISRMGVRSGVLNQKASVSLETSSLLKSKGTVIC